LLNGIDDDDADDDVTILMCAQKLTDASLIYRTKPETKVEKRRTKNNKKPSDVGYTGSTTAQVMFWQGDCFPSFQNVGR